MAKVITTLGDALSKLNSLYEGDSTSPTSGEEDFEVWTSLINIGVNIWEYEEGMLWKELFSKLADAATGDKTITSNDYSYAVPTNFSHNASGYVWIGSGTNKIPFKVIKQEDVQLQENGTGRWCYFLMDTTPTLEFNPNATLPTTGQTISYNYYKTATALAAASDIFEMADPMFAVYFALGELKKEEGDTSALSIATQKLEAMKTRNTAPAYWQEDTIMPRRGGFGV